MPANPLNGQIAVVTGASHGIGEAIARRLASMGAEVVMAARDTDRLKAIAREIELSHGRAHVVGTDLRRPEAVSHLIATASGIADRLDILVNNAGVGSFGQPLHETDAATWDAIMETNLRAVYLAIRAAAPIMIRRKSGHIINISSLASHNPVPNGAAYAASKWGLNGLTVSVAEELRAYGIRASIVSPGSVDTELVPGRNKDRSRMLQPEDVAHVVAMIVTQESQSFASEVLLRPTMKP
jgi:3-oxoacyl-[acyl-carrier protein] reductase